MAIIIFIIFLALIALLNGDSSGVEAIGKIIGGIILFIIVGYVCIFIMDNLLIAIGIIAIIILIAVIYNKANNPNTKRHSKETDIIKDTSSDNIVSNYNNKQETISEFQKELQENTKTPQQVNDERLTEEQERAYKNAQYCYDDIKKQLLTKAKEGQYITINGQKQIQIDYYYKWIFDDFITHERKSFFTNKTIFNPTGTYITEQHYDVRNKNFYNCFISKIKKLGEQDGIDIKPMLIDINSKQEKYQIPLVVRDFGSYKFYLRCTITY